MACFGGPAHSSPFPLLPVSFPALASPGMAEERAASRRAKPGLARLPKYVGGSAWWLNQSPYLLFYLVFNSYLMSSPKHKKIIKNNFLKYESSVCKWQGRGLMASILPEPCRPGGGDPGQVGGQLAWLSTGLPSLGDEGSLACPAHPEGSKLRDGS